MTNPKMKMTKMTLTTLTTNQNTIMRNSLEVSEKVLIFVTPCQARCDRLT